MAKKLEIDGTNIFFGVIIGAGILFLLALLVDSCEQSRVDTQVLLEIEYCNGKVDTLFTTINGTANRLRIENDNKHLSVPELQANGRQVIALNVCSFKILNKTEIRK